MVRFLNALRARGAYDTSDIVLMADHGESLSGKSSKMFFDKVQALSGRDGGRFSPLFAVKRAGATGPMALSDAPLQLMDLRSTLCAMVQCATPTSGVDAFDPPPTRAREVLVYGAEAHRYTAEHDRLPTNVKTVTVGSDSDALKRAFP